MASKVRKAAETLYEIVKDHLLEHPEYYGTPLHKAWCAFDKIRDEQYGGSR